MERNWKEIDRYMAISDVKDKDKLDWFDMKDTKEPFRVSGLYWFSENKGYCRVPEKWLPVLSEKAPGARYMAEDNAGGQIAFETDAERIVVDVELECPQLWDHSPATMEMGCDCYIAYEGEELHFGGVTRFDARKNSYVAEVLSGHPKKPKQVVINLPLYDPVESFKIGLPKDAYIKAPKPFAKESPIVVYGTSTTQGGCVSRPGILPTNVIGRRMNREILNFGFSGSGNGEPELAQILAEIRNPAMYELEYENNACERIYTTLEPFLDILREKHPDTPVLVSSRVPVYKFSHIEERMRQYRDRREYQRKTVERRRAEGDKNLYFLDGWKAFEGIRDPEDLYVDGIHPTDLGARAVADFLEPWFRKLAE